MEDEIKLNRFRRVVEFLKGKGHNIVSAGPGFVLVDGKSFGQYDVEAAFQTRYQSDWPAE